jgi:hypothetical protein
VPKSLILVLLAMAAIGVLPPFFTHGACTAEFDAVGAMLERARPELLTPTQAQRYLNAFGIAYQLLSAEQCESMSLPEVAGCPAGSLLLGAVPVKNKICRYYRDGTVRFQLHFNTHSQLVRIQTDMNPYRMLKAPMLGLQLDVAK